MTEAIKTGAKKMAETGKTNIVSISAIIGCFATVVTCGLLIGNIQGDLRSVVKVVDEIKLCQNAVVDKVSTLNSKQSFLEGQVSAQLTSIHGIVNRVEKQVDDLIRE